MEQSVDTNLPKIRILGMDTDETGKLNVEFEVCDEFLEYAKFELQKDELTQEELGEYVSTCFSALPAGRLLWPMFQLL